MADAAELQKTLTMNCCRYIIGDPRVDGWDYCREPRYRKPDGQLARGAYCLQHWKLCCVPLGSKASVHLLKEAA